MAIFIYIRLLAVIVSAPKQPIGVFDSGIGGLIALRKLITLLPHEDFIYLGDTARVPYGNRSTQAILQYSTAGIHFLLQKNVKHILIACNTVCSVALPILEAFSSVPITDVIRPAVTHIIGGNYQRVGIIGTHATIQSKAYEKEIQTYHAEKYAHLSHDLPQLDTYAQACPLFVPIIEEGWTDHAVALLTAQEYLAPLLQARIEALILGCTHYAFMIPILQHVLPQVCLIDSGEEAALTLAKTYSATHPSKGTIQCYMTDVTPTATRLAKQFLGLSSEVMHYTELTL